MEREWQNELCCFLDEKYREFVAQANSMPATPALRISPPLSVDEAKYFLLGVEAGLFAVGADGQLQSSLIADDPAIAELFSASRGLMRITLCRFSTAAALILQRGWLPQQIQIGAPLKEKELMPQQMDITVTASDGSLVAAVDIRRTTPELEKLRRDLQQCG